MITVIVIDDGINNVGENAYVDVCYEYHRGKFIKSNVETMCEYSHGTMCAGI